MRCVILIVIVFFTLSPGYGIECIDNNAKHLYFLDNAVICQYDLATMQMKKRVSLPDDYNFITAFYRCKKNQDPDFKRINRRLQVADYFNVTCHNDKVFISGRFLSLDTSDLKWEYLIIEYSKDLEYRNIFIMNEPKSFRYGCPEPYPRFRLLFNDTGEVMLTIGSLAPKFRNEIDSEYNFAIFKLDGKKNELRFKRLVFSPRIQPKMMGIVFYNFPQGKMSYPLNVPLSFSENPAWFSFPYVIINNLDGDKTFDPFHHVRYSIDSSRYLSGNYSNIPLGNFYNTLYIGKTAFIRELILTCSYQNDTLKFVLRNYGGVKDKLVEMVVSQNKYIIHPLNPTDDLDNTWFHFVNGKILSVQKIKTEYVLKYSD